MSSATQHEQSEDSDTQRARISVVIPVRNRPELAFEAIESATRQSHPPIEVIVVDDASEPPFALNLTDAASSTVRLFRLKQNSGAAAARNAGVRIAHGTHVAFLDSDDLWLPSHLEGLVKAIEEDSGAVAAYSLCRGRARWPLGAMKLRRVHARRIGWPSPLWKTPATMVLRDVFLSLEGFEETLTYREDTDLFIRLQEVGPVMRTGRITVVVRKQPTGLSGQGDKAGSRLRDDYARVVGRQIQRARESGQMRGQGEHKIWREFRRYWAVRWLVKGEFRRAAEELVEGEGSQAFKFAATVLRWLRYGVSATQRHDID